jgi:acetylornithine aminotransferase/acetylornithine/N-succinyldiaminopimelate aminotransferase
MTTDAKETPMTMVADDVRALEARHVLQTYRRQPITFVRGRGVYLYDSEGREYVDLLSGIGVTALGHAHERLTRAISEQAETLLHTSNLFFHPLQGQLAERLTALSGLERAFFCNSGTEAIEACLKFARRYWHTLGETRTEIVALEESFHGRTIGSLSVTSDPHYRAPFEPLLSGVRWISTSRPSVLNEAVTRHTAAIILEPIQGEGGVRPLTRAFAMAVNDVAARTGALVIADEVQSGCGRTGYPFYSAAIGLKPQLMALGKALGAGVPVGAALVSGDVAAKVSAGDHGTTYGGNLLACRAALCFLDELVGGGLLAHVGRIGAHFDKRLNELAAKHTVVREVRGAGVMRGIELKTDAAAVVPAGLKQGVVVNRTADNVIRLLPPYVITEAELDEGLARLDRALTDFTANGGAA